VKHLTYPLNLTGDRPKSPELLVMPNPQLHLWRNDGR